MYSICCVSLMFKFGFKDFGKVRYYLCICNYSKFLQKDVDRYREVLEV